MECQSGVGHHSDSRECSDPTGLRVQHFPFLETHLGLNLLGHGRRQNFTGSFVSGVSGRSGFPSHTVAAVHARRTVAKGVNFAFLFCLVVRNAATSASCHNHIVNIRILGSRSLAPGVDRAGAIRP